MFVEATKGQPYVTPLRCTDHQIFQITTAFRYAVVEMFHASNAIRRTVNDPIYRAMFKTPANEDAVVRLLQESMILGPVSHGLRRPPTFQCADHFQRALQACRSSANPQTIATVVWADSGQIWFCPAFFRKPALTAHPTCPGLFDNEWTLNAEGSFFSYGQAFHLISALIEIYAYSPSSQLDPPAHAVDVMNKAMQINGPAAATSWNTLVGYFLCKNFLVPGSVLEQGKRG